MYVVINGVVLHDFDSILGTVQCRSIKKFLMMIVATCNCHFGTVLVSILLVVLDTVHIIL